MADDNKARYRSSDPLGRGPISSGPANDPLAELARLIGQQDPFAEFGRDSRSQTQPNNRHDSDPNPTYDDVADPGDYGRQPPAFDPEPPQQYPEDLPRFRGVTHGQDNWPGPPSSADYHHASQHSADHHPAEPSDPFDLPPQLRSQSGFEGEESPVYPEPPRQSARTHQRTPPPFDPPSFLTQHARQGFDQPQQPVYPAAPDSGAMPAPHDDEFYDDAPRGNRRKGLLTVAAVFALAVVGTAGAVGYRSLFSGPASSGPPPVIRASAEPSKVAPPPAATDPSSAGKFTFDRFADRGKDEQVVKREETPIDPKELARTTAPRTVFPGAPAPNSASSRPGTTATANPPSAIGEPRRVRTVPIRPDQADIAANMPSGSADGLPPLGSRQASAAPLNRPMEIRPDATSPAVPPSRTSPTRPAPSANTPLSLNPEGGNTAPPAARDAAPQAAAERQAAISPPPRTSSGGRFHVQVASQKSETDAEQSFRGIQSKFSSVLGGQPHMIRRADLGSKGIYYRAMVGPFGTREEAVQLCVSLKSAGGDCVVQAN